MRWYILNFDFTAGPVVPTTASPTFKTPVPSTIPTTTGLVLNAAGQAQLYQPLLVLVGILVAVMCWTLISAGEGGGVGGRGVKKQFPSRFQEHTYFGHCRYPPRWWPLFSLVISANDRFKKLRYTFFFYLRIRTLRFGHLTKSLHVFGWILVLYNINQPTKI